MPSTVCEANTFGVLIRVPAELWSSPSFTATPRLLELKQLYHLAFPLSTRPPLPLLGYRSLPSPGRIWCKWYTVSTSLGRFLVLASKSTNIKKVPSQEALDADSALIRKGKNSSASESTEGKNEYNDNTNI